MQVQFLDGGPLMFVLLAGGLLVWLAAAVRIRWMRGGGSPEKAMRWSARVQGLFSLFAALLATGCPGDDDCSFLRSSPSEIRALELGRTDSFLSTFPFAPYADGEIVVRQRGFQGGRHIRTFLRVPASAEDGTQTRCMRVTNDRVNPEGKLQSWARNIEFERDGEYWRSASSLLDSSASGLVSMSVSVLDKAFSADATITLDVRDWGGDVPIRVGAATFRDGETIPSQHLCAADGGANISPEIGWVNPPNWVTDAFAVVLTNRTEDRVQWVIYNHQSPIDADVPDGYEPYEFRPEPHQAPVVTEDGTEFFGYHGPCSGGAGHTYEFAIHALDRPIVVDASTTLSLLIERIDEATVETNSFTGVH